MTPSLLLCLSLGLNAAPQAASDEDDVPVVLEYSAPDEAEKRTVESYHFTAFEPSAKPLYVGADEANLRASPQADASVVTTLPLGAAVRVLAKGPAPVKQGDYVNVWYQVESTEDGTPRTGWLFGGILTPFRFEEDFDGDGEKEVATVVMSSDFKIRVRVREPDVQPPRRVSSVDVETSGGAYFSRVGGPAEVKLVPAKKAGLPLLQVDSRPEACADFSTAYVSYVEPKKKKGVLGKTRIALELSGLSDPPQQNLYTVSFQDKGKKVTVLREDIFDEDEGTVTKKRREVYAYREGTYVEVKKAPASPGKP
jgi:hypothetical protein